MEKGFESYLFEKDDIRASNWEVLTDRPHLLGILFCLSSLLFILLEIYWLAILFMIGFIITLSMGYLYGVNKKKKVGNITKKLKMDVSKISIEKSELYYSDLQEVKISLNSFGGELQGNRTKSWKSDGCDNEIEIHTGNGVSQMSFWLPTYHHVNQLKKIDFPKNVKLMNNIIP